MNKNIKKLFVDKSIEIKAPAYRVWQVLTVRENMDKIAAEFSPDIFLEADWRLGGDVLWKDKKGRLMVEGKVVTIEPGKMLRFTVNDVMTKEKMDANEDDGITYKLTENDGITTLKVTHGDFSTITDGEKYYQMSLETWIKLLPKIRKWAEGDE